MRGYAFRRTRYTDPGSWVVVAEVAGTDAAESMAADRLVVVPVDEARRDPTFAEAVHAWETGDDSALDADEAGADRARELRGIVDEWTFDARAGIAGP